ncbi:MAG: hypothetical protein R3228_18900, partial [Halioglobus sp.]|nr:hypothetical protein [Halioglobus sp.]
GILPSGDFYRIYQAQCSGQPAVDVASLDGGQRWCIGDDGALTCFRRAREASSAACAAERVAASDDDLDRVNAYQ